MIPTSTTIFTEAEELAISQISSHSKAEEIAWASIFGVLSIFIVVENLLTIVLFAVNKKIRKKKSLFLVINMATADLIFGALALPLYIYLGFGMPDYKELAIQNGDSILILSLDITSKVSLVASLLSAALIACERFYAIYQPLNHRTLTARKYRIVIFAIWIMALPFSSLVFLIPGQECTYVGMPFASILLTIICGCNIAIWRKFQRGNVASQQKNKACRKDRLTKTLILVSLLALICWLPFVFSNALMGLGITVPWRHVMIVNLLNFSNSCVNPVVYASRVPEFQQALAFCCGERQKLLKKESTETSSSKNTAFTSTTQIKKLEADSSHPHVEEAMDVKLYSTEKQELVTFIK
ncbi:adenosine receptor A3-like [Stylophora pistillata]|nr:adenosine receptor A3-like [Stylophora pistillata]